MNKRLVLNVMIIAMLTFYMIFNIIYTRVINGPDPEEEIPEAVWEQPLLVPNPWHLVRLEFSSLHIYKTDQGNWRANDSRLDESIVSNIGNAWKNLQAMNMADYQQLPLKGITVLAFVEEDSQPLVFRVVQSSENEKQLQFYRMIDKKLFSFPLSSKSQFIPELAFHIFSQTQFKPQSKPQSKPQAQPQ